MLTSKHGINRGAATCTRSRRPSLSRREESQEMCGCSPGRSVERDPQICHPCFGSEDGNRVGFRMSPQMFPCMKMPFCPSAAKHSTVSSEFNDSRMMHICFQELAFRHDTPVWCGMAGASTERMQDHARSAPTTDLARVLVVIREELMLRRGLMCTSCRGGTTKRAGRICPQRGSRRIYRSTPQSIPGVQSSGGPSFFSSSQPPEGGGLALFQTVDFRMRFPPKRDRSTFTRTFIPSAR